MASITFAAPVIRAALATLEGNLPAQVAAFNAESANETQLSEPAAYVFGAADPLLAFPSIEVAATAGSTSGWAVGRSEVDHDVSLTVVCWHEGERGELAPTYEMSLGMARSVIETLSRPEAFGAGVEISNEADGVTWRTDVLPADLTEATREFSKWQVAVLITFKLETVEHFV